MSLLYYRLNRKLSLCGELRWYTRRSEVSWTTKSIFPEHLNLREDTLHSILIQALIS